MECATGGYPARSGLGRIHQELPAIADAAKQNDEAQKSFLRVTDSIPEEAWYWAAVGSIGISALFKIRGRNDLALFVGQWPPTFLLFGLYHRLLHPGQK